MGQNSPNWKFIEISYSFPQAKRAMQAKGEEKAICRTVSSPKKD